jgi:hypothetical protein
LRRSAGCILLGLWIGAGTQLAAQESEVRGRFELSAGGGWTTATSGGSRDATLTTSSEGELTLFETRSEIGASPSWHAALGIRLSPTFQAEVSASYGTPELSTRVTADFEGAEDITVVEQLTQYVFQAGLVQHLPGLQFARVLPFASAGAGLLRVLHEEGTLAETGATFYFGGGVTVPLTTSSSGLKMLGVRAEARGVGRREGAAFDKRVRVAAALGASLVFRF